MAQQVRSYWDLLEPHWSKLGNYNTAAEWLTIVDAFPQPIILLYAAHFSQSEVCNGGLHQLFYNSTGVMAPEAIAGFYAIGMPLLAQIVRQAAAMLGGDYPRERRQRWDAMLKAGPLTEDERRSVATSTDTSGSAYWKATSKLDLQALDTQFFKLVCTEAGGFESAATAYAVAVESTLVWPRFSPNPSSQE